MEIVTMAKDDIKSMAELLEELDPQGEKAEKEDLLGVELVVQNIKPWVNTKGKQAVRVIAVRQDTGELVHFSGGEPMWKGVEKLVSHVPFKASLLQMETKDGTPFWLLE